MALALSLGMAAPAAGADPSTWRPVEIVVRVPPFLEASSFNRFDYVATEKATRPWRLCGAMAGMGFDFIDAVIYGVESEASRHEAAVTFLGSESGDMDAQKRNVEKCLADGADAIIVLAGGSRGLEDALDEAARQKVPVINVALETRGDFTARIVPDDVTMGEAIGRFLTELFPVGGRVARVVWLPGPGDSDFGPGYDEGFRHAIGQGAIEVVGGGFTPLDPDTMRQTVSDAVGTEDVTAIAGIGPLIVPVMEALDGRETRPLLISTSITPKLVEAIGSGEVAAVLNTKPVVMGRIATDIAIRALEGRQYLRDIGPFVEVVDQGSLAAFDGSTAFVQEP